MNTNLRLVLGFLIEMVFFGFMGLHATGFWMVLDRVVFVACFLSAMTFLVLDDVEASRAKKIGVSND